MLPESPPIVSGVSDMRPPVYPNMEETQNPMQVSVKICFRGQISCHRNAENKPLLSERLALNKYSLWIAYYIKQRQKAPSKNFLPFIIIRESYLHTFLIVSKILLFLNSLQNITFILQQFYVYRCCTIFLNQNHFVT